ncbi:hypothetical protein BDN67DRAFT_233561 [Paxillus ammoniavirescens]|nr:hypothetical protein BDN67DRAFT_233561 [Paxillus ammoniavirescens]
MLPNLLPPHSRDSEKDRNIDIEDKGARYPYRGFVNVKQFKIRMHLHSYIKFMHGRYLLARNEPGHYYTSFVNNREHEYKQATSYRYPGEPRCRKDVCFHPPVLGKGLPSASKIPDLCQYISNPPTDRGYLASGLPLLPPVFSPGNRRVQRRFESALSSCSQPSSRKESVIVSMNQV